MVVGLTAYAQEAEESERAESTLKSGRRVDATQRDCGAVRADDFPKPLAANMRIEAAFGRPFYHCAVDSGLTRSSRFGE
jgi:hypothetical protein